MKLTVDEFTGRGLETVRNPSELHWVLNTVIRALPEDLPKQNVLGMFDDAWAHCRGD